MAQDMKKLTISFILLLLFFAAVFFWANRANLSSIYDSVYWNDRFNHSQWQLPLSPRTLGDNGLYAFEGYQLIRGGDPTKYNAEIPPLGKYIIGAAIQLFGNGSWYGVITSLLICILFYMLAKKIVKTTFLALAVTAIVACDPLLVSQWPATMLDNLHLVFLLLFFILLGGYTARKKKISIIIISGIALGAFSAVKFPVMSTILISTGAYYIWRINKNIRDIIILISITVTTYILTYTRYFLLGHTLIDWFHVQTWMINFYYHSSLQANIGSIWTILLVNRYQNLFTKLWQPVAQWTASWPIITILTGYAVVRFLKQKPHKTTPLILTISMSIILMMVLYSATAFWTRYLLLILPFLYLGAATVIRTFKHKWMIIVCIFALISFNSYTSWHILFPAPDADVQQFVYDWKNGFFQDMYERFTIEAKNKVDRYTFLQNMQQITRDGEIEATDISINTIRPHYVALTITYHTRNLGDFTEQNTLPIVNENNQWRIPWETHNFISALTNGDTLKTTVIPAKRGTLTDHTGQILARDIPGFMLWITPKHIDTTKEQTMLHYLEISFEGIPSLNAVHLYHRYSVNSQPNWPIPIGVLPQSLSVDFPGLTLTPAIERYETTTGGSVGNTHFTECCSHLYTTTTYDGISGLEQTYNDRLKGLNGGTLTIIDNKGTITQTLIHQEKKDGEDVSL